MNIIVIVVTYIYTYLLRLYYSHTLLNCSHI